MEGMSKQRLDREIKETQKALENLRVDEVQLATLEAEKAATLRELQGGKSRDFARMAEVEGHRAALASMLEDQRAEIERTAAHLEALGVQRDREGHLERVESLAAQIEQSRAQLHGGLRGLVESLTPELERLIGLHGRWADLRAQWVAEARALGEVTGDGWGRSVVSDALLSELQGRGVNVDVLRYSRGFQPETTADVSDPLPLKLVEPFGYAAFPERVETFTYALFTEALNGWHAARSDRARAHRGEL